MGLEIVIAAVGAGLLLPPLFDTRGPMAVRMVFLFLLVGGGAIAFGLTQDVGALW